MVFEAFFTFDLAPFVAALFTGVGVPCIFFLFPLKIFHREVLFRFSCPLLLIVIGVGAAGAGGDGDITGEISCE